MKKGLILLSCVFGLLMFSFSETKAQFTIQAGVNSSSWRLSAEGITIETESVAGFHLGGNYRKRISTKFFFMPGLHFTTKGASLDFGFGAAESKQSYLDIPLIFTYQANELKGFFAEGGPYIGLLLAADVEGEDVKDEYNSIDAGLAIGLGYDFGQFLLGIRGNLGFTNIGSDEDLEEVSVTNSTGSLFGAYKF